MRSVIALFIVVVFVSSSCSRKWKQPVACAINLEYSSQETGTNEIHSASLFTASLQFTGERAQAGYVNIVKSINEQINSNSSQNLNMDLPQGTYDRLDLSISFDRETGAAHTIKIVGKHHYTSGGFDNFQININEPVIATASALDGAGSSNVVLSKKVPRSVDINLHLNSVLDGIDESEWLDADKTGGMIMVDETNNPSIYYQITTQMSEYLEVTFL